MQIQKKKLFNYQVHQLIRFLFNIFIMIYFLPYIVKFYFIFCVIILFKTKPNRKEMFQIEDTHDFLIKIIFVGSIFGILLNFFLLFQKVHLIV